MTDLPAMPVVGATVHLHGGSITREGELRFTATRAGKRIWTSHPNVKLYTIAFMTCANRLRKANGLAALKLPCGYCGLNERYDDHNIYCSQQCRQKASEKAVTPKRGEAPVQPPQPPSAWQHAPVPTPRPVDIPKRYLEHTDIAPDYAAWVKDADALINRRLHALEQGT